MLSKKNSMVTMVTDEFLENRIILQKPVATIGFIWFFWFQKCILLYIFAQVFFVMRSIRSHISLFRLGFTPTLKVVLNWLKLLACLRLFGRPFQIFSPLSDWNFAVRQCLKIQTSIASHDLVCLLCVQAYGWKHGDSLFPYPPLVVSLL